MGRKGRRAKQLLTIKSDKSHQNGGPSRAFGFSPNSPLRQNGITT